MRWVGLIFLAVLFATLPATAPAARGPQPPVYSQPATQNLYSLHGTLTRYVPAVGLRDGSITIRVTWASPTAAFAVFSTLTFRVTSTTVMTMNAYGRITNGESGWVKLTSPTRITTTQALQALPAAVVMADGRLEQPPPLHV